MGTTAHTLCICRLSVSLSWADNLGFTHYTEVIAEIEHRVHTAGRGLVKDGTPEHLLTAKGLRAATYDECIKVIEGPPV